MTIKNNVVGGNASHKGEGAIVVEDASALFVNAYTGDFRLANNSRAIDNAYSGTIHGVPCIPDTDIVGTARPQGSGYDIGAYEWQ
ncbi:MAG: hypothetical protein J6I73_04820 [Treponema sp.]|nr:hypothetical protein [Treponema sp.]